MDLKYENLLRGHSLYRVEAENGLVNLDNTIRSCRSYRRYSQDDVVDLELMVALVNLARRSASAANRQPLRYHIVSEKSEVSAVLGHLGWAGLMQWPGPDETEAPTGYIIIMGPDNLSTTSTIDIGIAAQTICLGACRAGYGSCMLRCFDEGLKDELSLNEEGKALSCLLVIALGKPSEVCVLDSFENAPEAQDQSYWRDDSDIHHVAKRSLREILV